MAKNKNRNRRVIPINANRRLPVPIAQNSPYRPSYQYREAFTIDQPRSRAPRRHLTVVEDRRTYHPEGPNRDARSFSRFRSGLTSLKYGPITRVAFKEASRVLACVRRKARKEVMFAKNKAGRAGQRKPRFNWLSKISCKRR